MEGRIAYPEEGMVAQWSRGLPAAVGRTLSDRFFCYGVEWAYRL